MKNDTDTEMQPLTLPPVPYMRVAQLLRVLQDKRVKEAAVTLYAGYDDEFWVTLLKEAVAKAKVDDS